jgi:hypothetical protein
MKQKIFSVFAVLFIGFILFAPVASLALTCPQGGDTTGNQPCKLPDQVGIRVNLVVALIEDISDWMFTGLLILSVVMMLIAAYQYLFSGGSEEGTQKGKNYIVYTVIALAVAMLSKGIVYVVFELIPS